jgi:hypothetical protein
MWEEAYRSTSKPPLASVCPKMPPQGENGAIAIDLSGGDLDQGFPQNIPGVEMKVAAMMLSTR